MRTPIAQGHLGTHLKGLVRDWASKKSWSHVIASALQSFQNWLTSGYLEITQWMKAYKCPVLFSECVIHFRGVAGVEEYLRASVNSRLVLYKRYIFARQYPPGGGTDLKIHVTLFTCFFISFPMVYSLWYLISFPKNMARRVSSRPKGGTCDISTFSVRRQQFISGSWNWIWVHW